MGAPKEGWSIYKSILGSASPFSVKRLKAEVNRGNRDVGLRLSTSEFGTAPAFTAAQDMVTLADFFTGAHEFLG
jgi:hypothetical protein